VLATAGLHHGCCVDNHLVSKVAVLYQHSGCSLGYVVFHSLKSPRRPGAGHSARHDHRLQINRQNGRDTSYLLDARLLVKQRNSYCRDSSDQLRTPWRLLRSDRKRCHTSSSRNSRSGMKPGADCAIRCRNRLRKRYIFLDHFLRRELVLLFAHI
jgi:hypothetical protein